MSSFNSSQAEFCSESEADVCKPLLTFDDGKCVKVVDLNRPFQSQTDLFGTKILTPQFFLENILALCPKVGGSENFPPLDPLGP